MKKLLSKFLSYFTTYKFSGIIISSFFLVIIILLSLTNGYQIFKLKLYDLNFQIKPAVKTWDKLVFLNIDENSLNSIGKFPWPRHIEAKAIDTLKKFEAKITCLDIIFPDESPLLIEREKLQRFSAKKLNSKKTISFEDLNSLTMDNDQILSSSIKSSPNTVLTYQFLHEKPSRDIIRQRQSQDYKRAIDEFIKNASLKCSPEDVARFSTLKNPNIIDISYPIPALMTSATQFGFSDRDTDLDGGFRKIKLVTLYQDRIYFNLALVMLMNICGVPKNGVEINPGNNIVLKKALNPISHKREDLYIPIDKNGMLYVNWAKGHFGECFKHFPFYMLLEENIDDIINDVYDLFNALDPAETIKLAHLSYNYKQYREQYTKSSDDNARKQISYKIDSAWNQIKRIKDNFYKTFIKTNIDPLKKELSVATGYTRKQLEKDLIQLNDQLTMIKITIALEEISDSVVLSGLTATGTIDIGVTPLDPSYPRVGIYHNAINTILQQSFIKKPHDLINYLIMLIIAVFFGIIMKRMTAKQSLLIIVLSFAVITGSIILLFSFAAIWLDQLGITLAFLLPSISITAMEFINEESEKRFIRSAFSHYLSTSVIDEIEKNPESLKLGGENREVTVFFSDIKSFTSISELLKPEELVSLLNEYLSEMSDIIMGHRGTVDKYIGDAIMAFYGAPQNMHDHALQACLAGIEMKRRLRELQEHWRMSGTIELFSRMGINTGIATVGNMGSKNRMNYTVMGDTVNLASRLEGVNKIYGTNAIISESTYIGSKEYIEVRSLDEIRVQGKTDSVFIYELLGLKDSLSDRMYEMLKKFNQGMEYFRLKDWKKAKSCYKEALKHIKDDGPSLTYIKRCEEFIKKSPSKNWDGVYVMKSK